MKIETKFDIDDEVYFFDGDTVEREKINQIYIACDIDGTIIDYDIESIPNPKPEKSLFKTTKDLYKHIEKEVKKLLKDKE